MSELKKTLLFIGQCLTIYDSSKNKALVEDIINKKNINWDHFIKVSTSHLILPSLYCNFKRTNLISNIPEEVTEYMEYIFNLNKKRNVEIIEQVNEINSTLKDNNIRPIFLKGTSFLIEELYLDIGERMIGDIDILVSKKDFKKTIRILKSNGYYTSVNEKDLIFPSKHYPKMINNNNIAALEVHSNIILNRFSKKYNYDSFISKSREINNINIPSLRNQIIHNCINKQFSDKGRYYRNPSFRNSYDLYKLSLKKDPLKIIKDEIKLFNIFNVYLLQSNYLIKSNNLNYFKNNKSNFEKIIFLLLIDYKLINKTYNHIFRILRKIKIRFVLLIQMFYKPSYRKYFYRKYIVKKDI